MDIESESSETNLVIVTNRDRAKLFCKVYWRIIVLILTPLLLLPIAFLGENNAYKSFYVLIITSIYWITDVLHPCIVALVPIALATLMGFTNKDFFTEVYVGNGLLDCLGMMMIIVAIEYSLIHRRVALRLMLIFGCSHYRLSFVLFFLCMFLSMWMSNTTACGLMMPLVKAVLTELEKMGILEVFHTVGKANQKPTRHEQSIQRPTDFTIFYFLGIAYSSSIGGMATLAGSQTNLIFKNYYETIFPHGPKIEFPHFMLLNLPGVLVMETLLYLWMNFYYLGMFRAQSEIALEVGISEEESQYVKTLFSTQYQQLGKLKWHEAVVSFIVVMVMILQATTSTLHSHNNNASSTIVCALLLFITPLNMDFLKYFTRHSGEHEPLPKSPSKTCLNWHLVRNNIHWTVLFIIGSSCTVFETLKTSRMTDEFEKFLLLFQHWPAPIIGFVVLLFCKIFTEFANNSCVANTLLPIVARFSVISNVNPLYLMLAATLGCSLPFHLSTGSPPNAMVASYVYIPPWKMSVISNVNPLYLMLAATLGCSLPFHLSTGSPPNAMVASYVYIPPWKMMHAGIGPAFMTVIVVWFTITLWSKAVWSDINLFSNWANMHTLNGNVTLL